MKQLSQNIKVVYAGTLVAAGDGINNAGNAVDTAGWDGVMFVAAITGSVSTGVATATATQCATAAGTYQALTGTVATVTSGGTNDIKGKMLVVDVYRPLKRYLKLLRTSATANITYGDVIAILYHGRKPPAPGDAVAIARAASPSEAS